MKRIAYTISAAVVALVLALGPMSASAQDVVFGGPSSALDSASNFWGWSGAYLAAFRGALEDTANFGPGAPVELTIDTVDVSATDAATLSGVDVFVSSWWLEAQSAPHHANLVNWFLSGGSLLLLQDDFAHDGIGQALGVPSARSNGSPSSGDAPLFEGPFGSGDGAIQSGSFGQLDPADVFAAGGTIGGTNAIGQVTAAYWCPGDYAAGAGGMVILADVDMVSTWVDPDRYNPPNANGRLALNSAALLAQRCVTDGDGDGVPDDLDVCPDTAVPEGVPTVRLGVNRWALADDDGVFDTTPPPGGGGGPDLDFTIEDTAGCSCEQIIEAQGLGRGHEKFGCSISAMQEWVALVNP